MTETTPLPLPDLVARPFETGWVQCLRAGDEHLDALLFGHPREAGGAR